MKNKSIKRYFDDDLFNKVKSECQFLIRMIKNSKGEYDLRLRDNYFNLYYKGNSLAKVRRVRDNYNIDIHKKFVTDENGKPNVFEDKFFSPKNKSKNYWNFRIKPSELHKFLQAKHLKRLASNVKRVNFGEEIVFEQMFITDNSGREDFFIIDRQVTETSMKRKKMDLLALKQVKDNKYSFVVIEVKLGNNPELEDKVAHQLEEYMGQIDSDSNFESWKDCYQKNYKQFKELGLFDRPPYDTIEIIRKVHGVVLVGWHTGIADEAVRTLRENHPGIKVILKQNNITPKELDSI